MSATTLTAPEPQQTVVSGPQHRVTLPHVMTSEWIKFRSLRSSWFTLLGAVGTMVLIGLAIGYNTGSNWAGLAAEDRAPSATLQGYLFAQLLIGVLGVLFVSGEYGTGMIRSTLAAVPRRVPVLVAKTAVFGAIGLVTMVATSFATFLGGQAFLTSYGHGSSLDSGALQVILGTGVYLALIGLFGGALGWIVRSTAGGISVLVGILLVVPVVFLALPSSWSDPIAKFLPSNAGQSFISSVNTPGQLSAWTGFATLIAWVAGSLVVAAVMLRRRDG